MDKSNYFPEDERARFRAIIEASLDSQRNLLKNATSRCDSLKEDLREGRVDSCYVEEHRQTLQSATNKVLEIEEFIGNLKVAHKRTFSEDYGICVVTGKRINPKRLELVPHTQHSVAAKNARATA